MAKYGSGSVGFFLVGGYDVLGFETEITPIEKESLMEQSDTLGDDWQETTPVGALKAALTQNGFYDDAAAGSNEAFVGNEAVDRVMCLGHEGNTIGKKFMGFAGGFGCKVARVIQRAKLHKLNVSYLLSGPVEDGVILQELEAKTADWNTDAESVDNGALSANGGGGYQQVGAFTGFTGFIGKIRHSVDDAVYADLVTFANVTAARNGQRVTVAGTVNRHLLFDGDVTGSGSLEIMAGFVRNP